MEVNEAFPFIESLLIAIMRMVRQNLLDDDIDEGGPSNQQAANDEDDDDDELDKFISGIEVRRSNFNYCNFVRSY